MTIPCICGTFKKSKNQKAKCKNYEDLEFLIFNFLYRKGGIYVAIQKETNG